MMDAIFQQHPSVPLTGLFATLVFCVALAKLGFLELSKGAVRVASGAVAAMRDPALEELERENRVQRASLSLLAIIGRLSIRLLALAIIVALPLGLAHMAGFADAAHVMLWLSEPIVVAGLSFVGVVMVYVVRRWFGTA